LEIISSGYIKINNQNNVARESSANSITAYNEAGEKTDFPVWQYDSLLFDTTDNKSYDVAFGTEEAGIPTPTNGGNVNLPFNINVNQPDENMGYVRIFIDENCNLDLQGYDKGVKNINGNTLPEVYFFSNGEKTIRANSYSLRGYVIIPKGFVSIGNAAVEKATNKVFEGFIICGNVYLPDGGGRRLVYHKPLTYEEALTSDIYTY
jgi:hypothetical protein